MPAGHSPQDQGTVRLVALEEEQVAPHILRSARRLTAADGGSDAEFWRLGRVDLVSLRVGEQLLNRVATRFDEQHRSLAGLVRREAPVEYDQGDLPGRRFIDDEGLVFGSPFAGVELHRSVQLQTSAEARYIKAERSRPRFVEWITELNQPGSRPDLRERGRGVTVACSEGAGTATLVVAEGPSVDALVATAVAAGL
jgi:hypothetical protein